MKSTEPLDKLVGFYQSLDAIPTPILVVPPPRKRRQWSILFSPLGAALVAYAFMSFCALGPTAPADKAPVQLSMDRYARDEIRSSVQATQPSPHALNGTSMRSMI